jgi:hypothetical protein
MLYRELVMHLIGYNLIRCLMVEAAIIRELPLERSSFKGSVDTVRTRRKIKFTDSKDGRDQKDQKMAGFCLVRLRRRSLVHFPRPRNPGHAQFLTVAQGDP